MCPFEMWNTMNVYIHEFKDAQAASSKLIENALSNR